MNLKKLLLVMLIFLGISAQSEAQNVALRTNVLALAAGNINLEGSLRLGSRWSFHLPVQARPFSSPIPMPIGLLRYVEGEGPSKDFLEFGRSEYTDNYTIQPGFRLWATTAYGRGAFIGGYAIGTWFRQGINKLDPDYNRGFGVGAGVSVGYSYELSTRFNIEAEAGLGFLWRDYERVSRATGLAYEHETGVVPMVPRLGVSFVYLLK